MSAMPLNFLSRFQKKTPAAFITVVSGLPRSGTSMMMQILDAGGLPIVTDHTRTADDDNPKGYYELERVKALKEGDTAWVKDAPGKAVKVISFLLENLPPGYEYRVLFMQREVSEVLASQRQMLVRRGEPTDAVDDQTMADLFHKHLVGVEAWLAAQPNMYTLYVPYAALLKNPAVHIDAVIDFLELPLDRAAMLAVPDRSLYRQRKT
jgi:hypothetical protein